MDEFEILSQDNQSIKIEELSLDELESYKLELLDNIKKIEDEIKDRKEKKNIAENFFKK